ILSVIGAAVRLGDLGAAGLGTALLGLMLVLLAEPGRSALKSPVRSFDQSYASAGAPPPPPPN
ncbi:MAG TPA: hypothetical protein VI893_05235, partial [Thermoplasmata archaeon]|nr:hypothetical protein [Thermoplasmata archaeon]